MITNHLLRLPLELLRLTLNSLPDVGSLASAALSRRSLNWAFKGDEDRLIRNVLINCIGSDALPEALLVYRTLPPCTVDGTLQRDDSVYTNDDDDELYSQTADLFRSLVRPETPSETWTVAMREALGLSDFHLRAVLPLVQTFFQRCAEAAPPHVSLGDDLLSHPPSRSERERVVRVLYYFELYCRLYRHAHNHSRLFQEYFGKKFLEKFAPQEVVRLGCIHDFLAGEILPVYNNMAEHDITWGYFGIQDNVTITYNSIQCFLILGLEKIQEISSCISSPYPVQEAVLNGHMPMTDPHFLSYALIYYSQVDPHEPHRKKHQVFCPVEGPGAETIWVTKPTGGTNYEMYGRHDWSHRHWGYFMWDYERLRTLGVVYTSWGRDEELQLHYKLPIRPQSEFSYDARSDIYLRGGRGYWAEGDETHIVWTSIPDDPDQSEGDASI
ncbi:hypothetical protein M426DRAFT_21310 [Hypoxylon sp. CI-4A]|nr:hypothetical protein M426DRAFT_21310 [Hypoxylon sp. CI-4A]